MHMRCLFTLLLLLSVCPLWSQTGPPPIDGNSAGLIMNPGIADQGSWIVENGVRGRSISQASTRSSGSSYPLQTLYELTFDIRYGLFSGVELNSAVAAGMGTVNRISNTHFAPLDMGVKVRLLGDSIIGQLSFSGEIAVEVLSGTRKGTSLPQGDLRLCYVNPNGSKVPVEVNGGVLLSFRHAEGPLAQFGIRSGMNTPSEDWSFWVAYFAYTNFKKASHWSDCMLIKQVDDQLQLHFGLALELHPGFYFVHKYLINRYALASFGATYSFK